MKLKASGVNKRIMILVLSLTSITFGFHSCDQPDCLDVGRQIKEAEKNFIPMQLNDTIYYTNNTDTFNIICIKREYKEETDYYIDNYYQHHCDKGLVRRYWQLSTKYTSSIPYMDTTGLGIEFNIRSSPYLELEPVFDMAFFTEHVLYSNYKYSLYLNPDTPNRLNFNSNSATFNNSSLTRPALLFKSSLVLNNQLYKNVNILSGTIEYYDSVYYNNEYGIIRIANSDLKLDIVK